MKISATYSHINGLEYLRVHRPELWSELEDVISKANATDCEVEVVNETLTQGPTKYSAKQLRGQFHEMFRNMGWKEGRADFWITGNEKLARTTLEMIPEQQRQRIVSAEEVPIHSYYQIDFMKDRVAVEVQFERHESVAYDLFVRHLGLYVSDRIDVGIEILPMKSLQSQMSSGVPYFEGEFYNVIRQGRGVPAVPLVIIGIEP